MTKNAENVENKVENKNEEVANMENKVEKIERTSAIEKSQTPKTIKWIVKNANKLRFDLAIQRNTVWKEEQKGLFIHSLLYGFPFPPAYAQESNDGQFWLLDGKQRLTTVISFANDEFKLHKNTPEVFGFKVAGNKFSELPEQFQDEILDTQFTIWQMKNMTDEERDEMFYRLNNGAALSKLEVTRSMYSEFFGEVAQLSDLPFFADIISLTNSARNRFVDQELVVQIAMLLDDDYKLKGFGGTHIRDYVLNLKETNAHFPEEMVDLFSTMSTYLEEAFDQYTKKDTSKALKKINVPMVFMQAIKAKDAGMQPLQYGEFVKWFLVDIYNIESAYGVSCQAGSAKKENVLVRLKEMDKAFSKFIKKNPIAEWTPHDNSSDAKQEVAPTKEEEVKVEDKKEEPKAEKKEPKKAKATTKATGKKKEEKKEEKEAVTTK
jgi:hypothetical protein